MNSDTARDEGRQLRHNAARASILEAARRLVERVGVTELSLSAVAAEAGFGPSTVFGHFRNKDELLGAIMADDLASLGSLMRNSLPVAADASATPAVLETPNVEAQNLPQVVAEPSPVVEEDTLPDPQNVIPLRPESAPQQEDNVRAHQDAEPERPRVDAWLERRLRVFEHTLEDVDHRLKESEAVSARSVALAEHGIKAAFDRMETFERQQTDTTQALTQRMDETERRQRGATAEMRAAMNDTATRIEILESARRASAEPAAAFGKRPADTLPESVSKQTAEAPAPEPATGDEEKVSTVEPDTYRMAAQRAADAAATLVRIEQADTVTPPQPRPSSGRRIRLTRKHYVIAACFALMAFAVGAFLAFSMGMAHGRSMIVAKTPAHSVAAPKHVHAARAAPKPVKAAQADPRTRLAKLAEAGDPRAELLTGLNLLRGEGTVPDQPLAAQWIRKAADQHDALAQYWMGALYESGDGVAADSAEAVRWYEAAAAQGNRKAMHALGVAYAQGMGTQKDYSSAARWFSKAADLGLVNSEFNLGVLYERGLGVTQSLLDAYKWYAIAAAHGDQESGARVEILKTQLGGDSLAAADRAAQSFRPQPYDARANELPSTAELSAVTPRR